MRRRKDKVPTEIEPRSQRHIAVHRPRRKLPCSKGMLSHSRLAPVIDPSESFRVARGIGDELVHVPRAKRMSTWPLDFAGGGRSLLGREDTDARMPSERTDTGKRAASQRCLRPPRNQP